MITLYAFEPGFGMPSSSPFVTKVMILLKMAKLSFDVEIVHDLSAAPKGKLPYIQIDRKIIADSDIIRRHLERRYNVDFDDGLSPAERAQALAAMRLAEEHLYWCIMYHHWQVDRHWPTIKEMFFGTLAVDQRDEIADQVRQQVVRDLHGQGMGRHSHDEMLDFLRADLKALADMIGSKRFLFGNAPTGADAAIAPQILTIAADPFDGPLTEAVHAYPGLVPYARSVLAHFFPELKA